MGQIKLKSKKDIGSGNFEYVYECSCAPKPLKDITVTASNDKEGQILAQKECDDYCKRRH